MKKFWSLLICICMLMTFVPAAYAQGSTYEQMNAAFARLNVAELLPGWDIEYAREGNDSITLTCPKLNVQFRDVCKQLYALRSRIVTANAEDAMSLNIHYLYSAKVPENYLTVSQNGFGLFFPQESGLFHAFFGTSEFLNGDVCTGRKMSIYLHVNGGRNQTETDRAYMAKMKQLASEARAYSPYQIEQLDYFVRWMAENTTYVFGTGGKAPQLIVNGTGVCEHYANAVQDFCYLIGLPSLVVKNYVKVHAWNYIYLNNQWYEYDPTNYLPYGINEGTLLRTTYGRNAGDSFTANNLEYLKEETLLSRVEVLLNGRTLGFDQQPVVQNGRTLVPLRTIFEALGASVDWIDATQTVVARRGNTEIEMSIGQSTYYVNGQAKTLDVAPQVLSGRTLVPARAVAESFDCSVEWNESTNSVIVNSQY